MDTTVSTALSGGLRRHPSRRAGVAPCRRWGVIGLIALAVFVIASAASDAWTRMRLRNLQASQRAAQVQVLRAIVARTAESMDVDAALACAVAEVESGFDPRARSPRGAVGLMQLMPATAEDMARMHRLPRWDLYESADNALLGVAYLKLLLHRFHGNLHLALAAYHAGPSRVDGWIEEGAGLPGESVVRCLAFAETRAYVARVCTVLERERDRRTGY